LKGRLAHVEREAKANDPQLLRAEIARLKADLAKATKPQSVIVDQKAIEAAEARGWNAGAEATCQAFITKGHAVSDALAAMLAMPVPLKRSARTPGSTSSPPRQSTPSRANGSGELPKGERACLIAIAQHQDGVRREQLTVLTGYRRSTRDSYIARLRERGYVDQHGDRIMATSAGIAALGADY
jgi:hypothetical protein